TFLRSEAAQCATLIAPYRLLRPHFCHPEMWYGPVSSLRKFRVFYRKRESFWNIADVVPTLKSTKKFGRCRMHTQHEAIAVWQGQVVGDLVAGHECKGLLRLQDNRRSFATIDLSEEEVRAITSSRMNLHHEHLNELLDPK